MLAELLNKGPNVSLTWSDVSQPIYDHRLVTALSIVFFAYNSQFMVFNAYSELQNRSNERFAESSGYSILMATSVYSISAVLAILMFAPDDLKPNILDNVSTHSGSIVFILRLVFVLLLIFDIPFLYYATKEQSLVIHDEIVNSSLSKRCDEDMQQYIEAKAAATNNSEGADLSEFNVP